MKKRRSQHEKRCSQHEKLTQPVKRSHSINLQKNPINLSNMQKFALDRSLFKSIIRTKKPYCPNDRHGTA